VGIQVDKPFIVMNRLPSQTFIPADPSHEPVDLRISPDDLFDFRDNFLGLLVVSHPPEGFAQDSPCLHVAGHLGQSGFGEVPDHGVHAPIQEAAGLQRKSFPVVVGTLHNVFSLLS